jgi:hypothetical protein
VNGLASPLRGEPISGNKAWLRRRLHAAIVRDHLEAQRTEDPVDPAEGRRHELHEAVFGSSGDASSDVEMARAEGSGIASAREQYMELFGSSSDEERSEMDVILTELGRA